MQLFITFTTVKIICLLLSFYVIVLSARPCCTDDACTGNKTPFKKEQAPPDNDCAGCSPFFTCGTCMGFIAGQPLTYVALPFADAPEQLYAQYRQPYIQQVALAIWQPPKIS